VSRVKVYGADWCPLTKGTLSYLRAKQVDFEYINIDHDRESALWVAKQNGGKEKKPTLDIDGEVLSEPSDDEVEEVLVEKGILT
jgi:thioredoxin reductase (NADPH)